MDFAILNRQVVFGESGGRIIWQPRIDCWYKDKVFAGEPLPAPYTGMTLPEIYRALGCSARLYEFNECFRRIDHPSLKISRRELNETDIETVIELQIVFFINSAGTSFPSRNKSVSSSEKDERLSISFSCQTCACSIRDSLISE